jgi:hypothetical protein
MEKQGINGTILIADYILDEIEHHDGSVANTDSGLLYLPLISYYNVTSPRPELCEFRGLVLLQCKGQSRGHY